jgi:hypothetical protein
MTLFECPESRSETLHSAIDPHTSNITNRLNWLRAGVLGALAMLVTYGIGQMVGTTI